ncbi:hypothetical protein V5799_023570 [Amblyomma americanum]|uniref:2-phosphoxylose phosphatase 1 n=1 Tax=Amblyomma americanum TaxID=6943 RepID=A0AAQ4FHK6_AMBAM
MRIFLLLLLPATVLADPDFHDLRLSQLRHVVVIFRHTDRAPLTTFPGDPNRHHRWPLGLGELTSRGRAKAYALGRWLRNRYADYLTDNPREVYARSSPVPRCFDTAALVLYGLYPANREQKEWRPDQTWQPVPVTRLPDGADLYAAVCMPRVRDAMRTLVTLEEPASLRSSSSGPTHFGTLGKVFRFVAKMTNLTGDASSQKFIVVAKIVDAMSVAREHGLPLPTWASRYWRELKWAKDKVMEGFSRSQMDHMGGALLKDILARLKPVEQQAHSLMRGGSDSTEVPSKLTLMAYHDINIGSILLGLNGTFEEWPPYGAALLLEIFTLTSTVMPDLYVRVLYKAGDVVSNLALQGCSEPCSLQHFGELLQRKFKPVSRTACGWSDQQPLL